MNIGTLILFVGKEISWYPKLQSRNKPECICWPKMMWHCSGNYQQVPGTTRLLSNQLGLQYQPITNERDGQYSTPSTTVYLDLLYLHVAFRMLMKCLATVDLIWILWIYIILGLLCVVGSLHKWRTYGYNIYIYTHPVLLRPLSLRASSQVRTY